MPLRITREPFPRRPFHHDPGELFPAGQAFVKGASSIKVRDGFVSLPAPAAQETREPANHFVAPSASAITLPIWQVSHGTGPSTKCWRRQEQAIPE